MTPVELAAALKSKDDKQRAAAIDSAAECGPAAIKAVCPLLGDPETETIRAAKRALYKIVRDAGKPGAAAKVKAAEKEFVAVLQGSSSVPERREVLWMISEIGGDDSVKPVAALLSNADLREDARCVLQRIPGKASLKALENALKTAPEDFKFALAESLRKRGEKVSGYPSKRLVPTKATSVQPAA
jgi:HEAT repeat protein